MSKFPESGKVKTRLIPTLGAEGACRLHKAMSEHVIEQMREYCSERAEAELFIHLAGASIAEAEAWLGEGKYDEQVEGNLGVKIHQAVASSFTKGAKKVLVIGTDCPAMSAEVIEKALLALDESDIVFAPAHDGGYVLIGLSSEHYCVFQDINWGTDSVLRESVERLKREGLSYLLLPTMSDVDNPSDLIHAYKNLPHYRHE